MGLFSKKSAPPPPPAPVQATPPPPSMSEIVFKMRFTSKQIGRQAARSEKQRAMEERKAKEALARNNMAGARIHAESAIRNGSEALGFLKLQGQLEAVSAKLQSQQVRAMVSESMTAVTHSLHDALGSMDISQIGYTMERFIQQSEDLDLQTKYMDSAIGESTSSSTPQDQVNTLLLKIADENNLEVSDKIKGHDTPLGRPNQQATAQHEAGTDNLEARLAALQGNGPPQ